MQPVKAMAVVVVLASITACSNSDSDPAQSLKTEVTATPSTSTPSATTPSPTPKPLKTYVPAPGDPKTHVVTVIIRDKGRSYTPGTCVASRTVDTSDVLAFSGPTRHFENAPLKNSEFPIARHGRRLSDGTCEATMTVTVPYAPRYTVGIAQEGGGIPGPDDPNGDTKIVTKGNSQNVVLINYPT
jgi:hypothetical protein